MTLHESEVTACLVIRGDIDLKRELTDRARGLRGDQQVAV